MPVVPPAHLMKTLSDPRIQDAQWGLEPLLRFLEGRDFLPPPEDLDNIMRLVQSSPQAQNILRAKGIDPAKLADKLTFMGAPPGGAYDDQRVTAFAMRSKLPKLYHGTSSDVVDRILKEGALQPKDPHPTQTGTPDERIYMTPRKWQARRYAASAAMQEQPGTVEKDRVIKKRQAIRAGKFQGRKSTPAVLRIDPEDIPADRLGLMIEALLNRQRQIVGTKPAEYRKRAMSKAIEAPPEQGTWEQVQGAVHKRHPAYPTGREGTLPYEVTTPNPISKNRLSVSAKNPAGKKKWWPLSQGALPKGWKYALPAILAMLMAMRSNDDEQGDTNA